LGLGLGLGPTPTPTPTPTPILKLIFIIYNNNLILYFRSYIIIK